MFETELSDGFTERFQALMAMKQSSKWMLSKHKVLSENQIQRYFKEGSIPNMAILLKMSNFLCVSPAWLAWGEGKIDDTFDTDEVNYIASRLMQGIKKCGASERRLAAESGVSRHCICLIVAGYYGRGNSLPQYPRIRTIELLAKALNMTPGYLAFGKPLTKVEEK